MVTKTHRRGTPYTQQGRGHVDTEDGQRLSTVHYTLTFVPDIEIYSDGTQLEGVPHFRDGYLIADEADALFGKRVVLVDRDGGRHPFRILERQGDHLTIDLAIVG